LFSRSETLIELINIRKDIKKMEKEVQKLPDNFFSLKNEIDDLIINITGIPKEGQHQVHEILTKAYDGEIKPKTAVVAIYEIYNDFHGETGNQNIEEENEEKRGSKGNNKRNTNNKKTNDKELEELYRNGYR